MTIFIMMTVVYCDHWKVYYHYTYNVGNSNGSGNIGDWTSLRFLETTIGCSKLWQLDYHYVTIKEKAHSRCLDVFHSYSITHIIKFCWPGYKLHTMKQQENNYLKFKKWFPSSLLSLFYWIKTHLQQLQRQLGSTIILIFPFVYNIALQD